MEEIPEPTVGGNPSEATTGAPSLPTPPPLNLFAGIRLKKLKKKEVVKFTTLKFRDQWGLSIEERMRFLDAARKYKPDSEEASSLNIPEDRLDIHSMQNILYLCGGMCGVRFQGTELTTIARTCSSLAPRFATLEKIYEKLSSHHRKVILEGGPNFIHFSELSLKKVADPSLLPAAPDAISLSSSSSSIFKPPIFSPGVLPPGEGITSGSHQPDGRQGENPTTVPLSVASGCDSVEESATSAGDRGDGSAPVSSPPVLPVFDPENDLVEVIRFHRIADEYLELLSQIQAFTIQKQSEIVAADSAMIVEKDIDASSHGKGRSMPVWLTVLVAKYKALCADMTGKGGAATMTQGKLSAFASCCVVGKIPCSREESEAVAELVEASNDATLSYHLGDPSYGYQSQKYWAKRFFAFISKLAELKSCIRDEKSLYTFSTFCP